MITFDDVTYAYPGASTRPALRGVTFELHGSESVAVVGANGSGKSTLARLCDGLLLPASGTVTVDGIDTREEARVWEVRSRVGLVLQDPDDQIVGAVVEEDTAFGPENLGAPRDEIRRRVDAALATVGLTGLERREPHLLSEGQKQRLAIAGAIALDSAYLVLDEPLAMLDGAGRRDVVAVLERLVRDGGAGVLLVTHRFDDVARADRVLALREGEVAFLGSATDFLADAAAMTAVGMVLSPLGELAAHLRDVGVPIPMTAHTPTMVVDAL